MSMYTISARRGKYLRHMYLLRNSEGAHSYHPCIFGQQICDMKIDHIHLVTCLLCRNYYTRGIIYRTSKRGSYFEQKSVSYLQGPTYIFENMLYNHVLKLLLSCWTPRPWLRPPVECRYLSFSPRPSGYCWLCRNPSDRDGTLVTSRGAWMDVQLPTAREREGRGDKNEKDKEQK